MKTIRPQPERTIFWLRRVTLHLPRAARITCRKGHFDKAKASTASSLPFELYSIITEWNHHTTQTARTNLWFVEPKDIPPTTRHDNYYLLQRNHGEAKTSTTSSLPFGLHSNLIPSSLNVTITPQPNRSQLYLEQATLHRRLLPSGKKRPLLRTYHSPLAFQL